MDGRASPLLPSFSQEMNVLRPADVRRIFHYDPVTGIFKWREPGKGRRTDGSIGRVRFGYLQISVDYKRYAAHRLAWAYVYGRWPKDELDHKNRDRLDNRIANLREASRLQNIANNGMKCSNVSGFQGVSWHKKAECWRADIRISGKKKHLGYFDDPAVASQAYVAAAIQTHGDFACLA